MHNGIIFRVVVLFIPHELQHLGLPKVHEAYPGSNRTEALVRTTTWWPAITQEFELSKKDKTVK